MYRFVAGHVDVSGDRFVAYGDLIENPEQRLIDRGFVIPHEDAPTGATSQVAEPERQTPPPTPFNVEETGADAARN